MGNQQPSSKQEKVQRLSLLRGVRTKQYGSGWAQTGNAVGRDIVCAFAKAKEVHKRTAQE